MRPTRNVILVAVTILALGAWAPTVSAASTPNPLHVTKDCGTFTGESSSYCTITVSNLAIIPVGSRIWYTGPVLTNSYFLSSNVTLDARHGNTAAGYCMFEARTSMGLCTFWKGTGTFPGVTVPSVVNSNVFVVTPFDISMDDPFVSVRDTPTTASRDEPTSAMPDDGNPR